MEHFSARIRNWSNSLRNRWLWVLAIAAVGCFATLVAFLISLVAWPVPRIHDEFSHLLLADTLRHGRLSNPTPEVWQPLQSFHTILQPTYSSKYPLGPGLLLAIAWNLFGTPAAGLWLGAGLCAASAAWMLAGAVPRRWAVLGALLVALHPTMQVDWSRSYMNGWLTATSAMLMLGAVLRLRRRASLRESVILGAAIGLIAMCRPFEGLLATIVSGCILLVFWLRWPRRRFITALRKIAFFAAPGVAAALGLIAMHNKATTGCWHRMPYQVHEQQYAVAPLFITQLKKTPGMLSDYSNHQIPLTMLRFHEGWSYDTYKSRSSILGWLCGLVERANMIVLFWGVSLCGVPLLTMKYWNSSRICQCCAIGMIILIAATSLVPWVLPHYLAPILPGLVLLAVCGLQHFSRCLPWRRGPIFALIGLQILLLVFSCAALTRAPGGEWAKRRAQIESMLTSAGGRHLVLVRYTDRHNYHQEWVYNLADVESAPVIWARSCREDWDALLLRKYAGKRSIWVLQPDQPKAELTKGLCENNFYK